MATLWLFGIEISFKFVREILAIIENNPRKSISFIARIIEYSELFLIWQVRLEDFDISYKRWENVIYFIKDHEG